MSRPVKFDWPAMDVAAVCRSQAGAGGPLLINGTLASKSDAEKRTATFVGLERTVSIRSTVNLLAVNFTIVGTLNGNVVQQTVTGPNATTEFTTQRFTTVTSVTADAAFANASIGSGDTGNTVLYLSDYYRTRSSLLVAVYVAPGSVVSYTFETTPDNINDTSRVPTYWDGIDGVTTPTIPANVPMINCAVGSMGHYTFPTFASRITVNASDAATALEITMIAQGIL